MNKIQRPRKKTHALQFIHCIRKFFYIISSLFNLYFCLTLQLKFTLCIVTVLGNHIFKHAVNDNEKKSFVRQTLIKSSGQIQTQPALTDKYSYCYLLQSKERQLSWPCL